MSIPRFMVGDREAIQSIATCRHGLLIGLLLVFSAALAREYDAEYLVKEPWHLLISLGSSLVASVLFFVTTYRIALNRRIEKGQFLQAMRAFVTLFWMTAPLAWLYAIPFERFLSPMSAVYANLWVLKIVSVWRLFLMIKIFSLFWGCGFKAAFMCVMLIADIMMLVALAIAPFPVINLMGGIRLTGLTEVVANTAFTMQFLGACTLPIWLLGVFVIYFERNPSWKLTDVRCRDGADRWTILAAAGSVLCWLPVLPWTQTEQKIRYETESLLMKGRIKEGLEYMSGRKADDYPPHWQPPPRPLFGVYKPRLIDVMLVVIESPPAPWVADAYVGRFERMLQLPFWLRLWWLRPEEERNKILLILEHMPFGPSNARQNLEQIEKRQGELSQEFLDRVRALANRK